MFDEVFDRAALERALLDDSGSARPSLVDTEKTSTDGSSIKPFGRDATAD